MAAHQKAKQRVHTHKGVDFIVVPGSTRERVLLDLFQAEDRLAMKPGIVDPEDVAYPDAPGGWLLPLVVGAVSGFCAGILAGWAM